MNKSKQPVVVIPKSASKEVGKIDLDKKGKKRKPRILTHHSKIKKVKTDAV